MTDDRRLCFARSRRRSIAMATERAAQGRRATNHESAGPLDGGDGLTCPYHVSIILAYKSSDKNSGAPGNKLCRRRGA